MADTDLYLTLNASERAELLDAASRKRGIAVSVMEKDYWDCGGFERGCFFNFLARRDQNDVMSVLLTIDGNNWLRRI